jgi:hypothetical protein
MKKYNLLVLVALFYGTLFAQPPQNMSVNYYYYNGKKVELTVNKQLFTVYFDLEKITNNRIAADYTVIKEISLSEEKKASTRCCVIEIGNANFDSTLYALCQKPEIIDVEPVIGSDDVIPVSRVFYVQLKNESLYDDLVRISKETKTHLIGSVTECKNWYELECSKTSVSNALQTSSIFYETGLFDNVDPGFVFDVSVNCVNDSSFGDQWGMRKINACSAWSVTTGDANVKIAVIDQGVDENHRELSGTNVSHSFDMISYSSPAQLYNNYDPSTGQRHYHGIHVGGIIFANHNANQIAGVAPGTSLINISHTIKEPLEDFISKMAQAINRSVNQNADIINCSWGISNVSAVNSSVAAPLLESAIKNALRNGRNGKGCVVVFSSGNKIQYVDESPDILYPAYINDSILVVGAIDSNMVKASFSKYGSKLDVVAPGVSILSTHNNNGYATWDGTSMAAPHVSGIAGLILSVNPNLTGQQVRDIIESTAQKVGNYNYRPSAAHHNGDWWMEVGYGLVDAYAAVQKAMNHHNDLYIRDTATDDGTMPSSCYSTWDSPDIEVVDTLGHKVANLHGNTKYAVRVRIHNRRDVASSGTERLFLNWAKAGFNDSWDEYWTGNNPLPCGAPKGGVIGSANGKIIPSIPANSYRIDTIHWITPAGENYANCTDFNYNQWHFCLLARIHDDDVIAHENEHDADVHQLVKNHNNVAQQNVYLDSAENYRKTLGIGNVHTIDMSRIINLSPKVIGNISITDYAEVYITLDAGLLAAINGNANIIGLDWVSSNTLRWNGGSASIPVTLPANSYYTMQTTIHFIADQISANNNFDFDIVLRSAIGDSILGGEHYRCVRTDGRYFQATAHDNMTVLWGETATLYADDILETAEYKWYDDQGNEVGSGLTCNVNPLQNTTYTLRVTADADGYRAYSTVTVMVVDGELRMLAPNPADNQVRIGYALSRNVSSATMQILNGSGQVIYSQALSGGNGSKVTGETLVNTSSLAAGSYTVRLVSNRGNIFDSKTLVIR